MAIINTRELIFQISKAEPILVREAEKYAREKIFEPEVNRLQREFEKHPVTKEIAGGIESPNYSKTLVGFNSDEGRNLFSFIGFDEGDEPLDAIREFLDPDNQNGPKMNYVRGSQVRNLVFQFKVTAPNKQDIYNATPMPWADGISWAERIELGIPGVNRFLNKFGIAKSQSGGGIQVKANLRSTRFSNRSFLSQIFGDFLARF